MYIIYISICKHTIYVYIFRHFSIYVQCWHLHICFSVFLISLLALVYFSCHLTQRTCPSQHVDLKTQSLRQQRCPRNMCHSEIRLLEVVSKSIYITKSSHIYFYMFIYIYWVFIKINIIVWMMFQTPRKLSCSAVWLLFGNATLWSCRYWSMKPEAKTQDPLLGFEMTCRIVEINMSVASCFGGTFASYQPCTWIMWSIWRSICWLKQITTWISSLSTVTWSQRVDGDCTPFAFGRFFKGVEGSGLLIGWIDIEFWCYIGYISNVSKLWQRHRINLGNNVNSIARPIPILKVPMRWYASCFVARRTTPTWLSPSLTPASGPWRILLQQQGRCRLDGATHGVKQIKFKDSKGKCVGHQNLILVRHPNQVEGLYPPGNLT